MSFCFKKIKKKIIKKKNYLVFIQTSYFIFPLKIVKVKDNPSRDFKSMYRHISKGSWTLSDQDQGWQVSDCTAEAFKVINFV
jgi:hypothetical protein